jgi:hypothetical protein
LKDDSLVRQFSACGNIDNRDVKDGRGLLRWSLRDERAAGGKRESENYGEGAQQHYAGMTRKVGHLLHGIPC